MLRTKYLSTTSSSLASQKQPTNQAHDGSALKLHSRPETDDRNCRQTGAEQSADLDVLLAYTNACLHHYGLHAQYGEIEEGTLISELWEDDLEEED